MREHEHRALSLGETLARAAALLVSLGVAPADGRVSALPDRRTLRWYTTIGLVDRPLGYHGREARYGGRHVLQLVAIKALQAQGISLAGVQQRLAGATDGELASVAGLDGVPADLQGRPALGPDRARGAARRFWAEALPSDPVPMEGPPGQVARPRPAVEDVEPRLARRPRTEGPLDASEPSDGPTLPVPVGTALGLAPGLLLVFPAAAVVDPVARRSLAVAAAPLVAEAARLGLLATEETS